jgi:hypothetical protein
MSHEPVPYTTTTTEVGDWLVEITDPASWYQQETGLPGFLEFRLIERMNGEWADAVAEGSVKWDGCCNWRTDENLLMHACRPTDTLAFAAALNVAHETAAAAIMPKDMRPL